MSIAVLLLILTFIAAPMIFDPALLNILISSKFLDYTNSMISADMLVFVIFAGALLALEIVWWVLSSRENQKNSEIKEEI